jgi:hypothetical protein
MPPTPGSPSFYLIEQGTRPNEWYWFEVDRARYTGLGRPL